MPDIEMKANTFISKILTAASEIYLGMPKDYFEQDTIERVIVPTLRLLYSESRINIDTANPHRLIRGNRRCKGINQMPDLYLDLGNSQTFAIECKCCREDFVMRQRIFRSGDGWMPKSLDVGRLNQCKKVFSESDRDKVIPKRLKTYLGVTSRSDATFVDYEEVWKRCFVEGTLRFDDSLCDGRKILLTRLMAYQSNETTDILGQLWRYCCDGCHKFDCKTTKLVWTNGLRWVIFKPSFYDHQKWPNVPVGSNGEMVSCKYFDIVDLIEDVEKKDEGRFQEKLNELASYMNTQNNKEQRIDENA